MSGYDALLACFRSGQMSEAQMQEHLRADAVFSAHVRKASKNLYTTEKRNA